MTTGQSVQYLARPFPENEGDYNEIANDTFGGGMADNDNVKSQISNKEPMAAIITRVWGPSTVNLIVFPDCSHPVFRTSVTLGTGAGNFQPIPDGSKFLR